MTSFAIVTLTAVWGISPGFEPTAQYEIRTLEGWKVLVHKGLLEDERALGDATLKLLALKLHEIERVVPPPPLAELRKVPIWIETRGKRFPCACYHVSRDWLSKNGFHPLKAKAVEIANPRNFLLWTKQQPWMVLHELAHAYYDQVLRRHHPELSAAYREAVDKKLYDSVLHWSGKKVRAYALTNVDEFFAEATEAFFGTNDFFPFVGAELKHHDARTFDVLEGIWRRSQGARDTAAD